ncbi:hypothetical protein LTR08_002838 [Meristemomyces frigidus]|nr:hypothetical protein LTR08_002838 [Meristemomyces frigidus]
MPRPSRQCLDAVSIADDILAEACTRFARVSHFHSYTCRRYGSNVPGPLEAHRRLARRRMGLAAVAASSGPPPLDLGAMFGFGARPALSMEKAWKWEAPSLQVPGLGAGPPPPPGKGILPPTASPKKKVKRTKAAPRIEDMFEALETMPAEDPVQTSTDAFQALLTSLDSHQEINQERMARLVAFLQSAADEPKAMNVLTLRSWLVPRAITPEALQTFSHAIRDKLVLKTLSQRHLRSLLAFLLNRVAVGDQDQTQLVQLLEALPDHNSSRRATISSVTVYLPHDTDEDLYVITLWLRVLGACSFMQSTHHDHPAWAAVYQQLACYIPLTSLATHLGSLAHLDFAQVLLRYWLPRYLPRQGAAQDAATVDCRKHKTLTFYRPKPSEHDLQVLIRDFEASREAARQAREAEAAPATHVPPQPTDFPFIDLLATLARHHLPYTALLEDIFTILQQTKHYLALWGLFRALAHHPHLGVTPTLATTLIAHFVNSPNPRHLLLAWRVFKTVPSLSVIQCFDLPLKLIAHGYGTPARIFYMLNRKTTADIPFPEERETKRLALGPEHVDLVHLVAYAWASLHEGAAPASLLGRPRDVAPSPLYRSCSSRVAFRRVWQCYRFLKDRGAPLSPLLSRALVKAGVLRPLRERVYISLLKTRWIVERVLEIEGEGVAEELDRRVFEARQGNRVMRARIQSWGMWHRLGGDRKIVRVVRWRLKGWAKWGGGGRLGGGGEMAPRADGGGGVRFTPLGGESAADVGRDEG